MIDTKLRPFEGTAMSIRRLDPSVGTSTMYPLIPLMSFSCAVPDWSVEISPWSLQNLPKEYRHVSLSLHVVDPEGSFDPVPKKVEL